LNFEGSTLAQESEPESENDDYNQETQVCTTNCPELYWTNVLCTTPTLKIQPTCYYNQTFLE